MALLPLNWDVVNNRLVIGETNAGVYQVRDLYQEDTYTIEFRAFKRIRETGSPIFEKVNLAGYALAVSVGTAANPLAQATAWTPSSDNYSLTGSLAMNTSGINGLSDGSSQIFEVRLYDGTGYNRGQQSVVVRKSVATSGALVSLPTDTALGSGEASRLYVKKEGAAGEGFILKSLDGTKKALIYLGDDGTLRSDPY